jgi:hypothetical protein
MRVSRFLQAADLSAAADGEPEPSAWDSKARKHFPDSTRI